MNTLSDTDLYRATVAERGRMAALLGDLTPAQWNADSLCAGWRIREVVAHLVMTETRTQEDFGAAVAGAGGDVNVAVDRMTREDADRYSDAELLEIQRSRVASRWTPGPGAFRGALSHEVIHGLDIAVPLGLPTPSPDVLAATVAGSDGAGLDFFGVDLTGLRLTAIDSDLALGDGPQRFELPTLAVVLIATGRRPVPVRPVVG